MAGEFNFSPNEILEFDSEDFHFWLDRLNDYQEWLEKSHG